MKKEKNKMREKNCGSKRCREKNTESNTSSEKDRH